MIAFFVSMYTERLAHVDGKGSGIVPCVLVPNSGEMHVVESATGARNPAYLWLNARGDRLYAANEIDDFGSARDGSVSVFTVDRASQALTLLQEASSAGAGPAWVRGDASDRWLLVANQESGSVNSLWRDPMTGALVPTGYRLKLPTPCFVQFAHGQSCGQQP